MRTPAALIALVVAAALLVAGCGSSGSGDENVPTPKQATEALRGSPAPLAALHDQAAQLLPGDKATFARQLAALRGYPVVVNVWAAWCAPCQEEFPILQRAAVRYGGNVGFIGVDARDVESDARAWLRKRWTAYPSIYDPHEQVARDVGALVGLPTTVFFDRNGRSLYAKQGEYQSDRDFTRDLQRYTGALPSS
ncbi:MAG TPA: TlpA disulfide reductase family protein [Conexibacter sp.]|jgi:thiol-disulfide isomerase/thioredoxin